jgi:sodium-dependent dicarboxylate transporter 2/3/5
MSGLPPEQVGVAAVFGFAITLWVTEAIPLTVTAFLAVALLVIVGGVSQKTVFGAFGSSVILLFIGGFTLAKAFEVNGVHERIARWILTRPFAVRTPATLLLTVGSICLLFSLFISNTAATAMMLPIVLMVLKAVGQDKPGSKLSVPMMLMMTWGASFAVGTPVSTPPNAIGIGMIAEATGTTISFGQWMLFAMPIALTMLFFGWLLLKRLYLKGVTIELPERLQFDRPLEPWSQPQKVVVGIFGVVLACWLLPDILNLILGSSNPLTSWMDIRLTSGASALLGLGLCFIVPVKGTPSGRVLTKEQGHGDRLCGSVDRCNDGGAVWCDRCGDHHDDRPQCSPGSRSK